VIVRPSDVLRSMLKSSELPDCYARSTLGADFEHDHLIWKVRVAGRRWERGLAVQGSDPFFRSESIWSV